MTLNASANFGYSKFFAKKKIICSRIEFDKFKALLR